MVDGFGDGYLVMLAYHLARFCACVQSMLTSCSVGVSVLCDER